MVSQAGEKLELLRDAFRKELSNPKARERVNMIGDSGCKLIGSRSTQGRLYSGVFHDNVCVDPASGYTGNFIHVEQKRFIRIDPNYDQKWIHALNAVNFEEAVHPVSPPSPWLKFTSLNNNEREEATIYRYDIGEELEITWESQGLERENTVQVSIHRAVDKEWIHNIDDAASNSGSYTWKVPSSSLPIEEELILRVSSETTSRMPKWTLQKSLSASPTSKSPF